MNYNPVVFDKVYHIFQGLNYKKNLFLPKLITKVLNRIGIWALVMPYECGILCIRKKGKDVMKRSKKKTGSRVSFYNIVFDGEYGWFCDVYTSAICRINIENANISVETTIPLEENDKPFQYGYIAKSGNVLVIAPRSASNVLLYNMKEKKFQSVEIDAEMIEQIGPYCLISEVKIYDGSAYLIPGRLPGIIKINLSTTEITYINEWYTILLQEIPNFDPERGLFARCNCIEGNNLYLPCWQSNVIMIFNLATEKCSFFELSAFNKALSGMCIIDNEAWIAFRDVNLIIRLNREGEEIGRIVLEGLDETFILFLARCDRLLYAIPSYGNRLICMNLDTKEYIKEYNLVMKSINMPEEWLLGKCNMLSCVKDNEERIWMYSIFDGKIFRCSANGNIETSEAEIKDQKEITTLANIYLTFNSSEGIVQEGNQCGLEEFLGFIMTR